MNIESHQNKKYKTLDKTLSFVNEEGMHPSFLIQKMKENYFKNEEEMFMLDEKNTFNPEKMSFGKIREAYGINEIDLWETYSKLEQAAKDYGINIEYTDLTNFVEDEYYENEVEDEHMHAETARSDGKTLLLEQNINYAEGIEGRMYDLLHVGFGHMVQWSANQDQFILNAKQAWAIGYRNHDESPNNVLEIVKLYEYEGGLLGVQKLKDAMKELDFSRDKKKRISQFFTDLAAADREFIMGHYRGSHEPLTSFWRVGTPVADDFEFPQVELEQKDFVELGVIRELHK